VEGDNHLGDWGTPFGLLIAAYKRFGWDAQADVEDIVQLNALYVRATQTARAEAAFAEEGRRWFQRLEAGDSEARQYWRWFVDVSLAEFQKVYDLLGVSFEHTLGESFFEPYIDEALEVLEAKGLVSESDGALVVDLTAYDMPPYLLKKQDGPRCTAHEISPRHSIVSVPGSSTTVSTWWIWGRVCISDSCLRCWNWQDIPGPRRVIIFLLVWC
jgi:arginyl-tRNA synthetase